MPPTRQQSRARILRWERVVTGILNHFQWVRETGFRIFSTAYLLPRYVASERSARGWKLARPRPPEMKIGELTLWAGGHIYEDERSNFFGNRGFYPFEPRGGFFPPRWQPPVVKQPRGRSKSFP